MTAYSQELQKGVVIWIGQRSRSMCWKMRGWNSHPAKELELMKNRPSYSHFSARIE